MALVSIECPYSGEIVVIEISCVTRNGEVLYHKIKTKEGWKVI